MAGSTPVAVGGPGREPVSTSGPSAAPFPGVAGLVGPGVGAEGVVGPCQEPCGRPNQESVVVCRARGLRAGGVRAGRVRARGVRARRGERGVASAGLRRRAPGLRTGAPSGPTARLAPRLAACSAGRRWARLM